MMKIAEKIYVVFLRSPRCLKLTHDFYLYLIKKGR